MPYNCHVALLFVSLLCALLCAALCVTAYWRMVALDKGWRAAAERLGLQYEPRTLFGNRRIHGTIDDQLVRVDIVSARSHDRGEHVMTRATVRSVGLPHDFEISANSIWRKMAHRLGARTSALGDTWFDRHVNADGDPAYTLAALNPSVRDRLGQLTALNGQIRRGELSLGLQGRIRSADRVVQLVEFLVGLAGDLSIPQRDWPSALRDRATQDPSAEVRLRSLDVLVTAYPDSRETRRAVQDRLSDFVPEIRLAAARHADGAGVPVVSEIFYDPDLSNELRIESLRIWAMLSPRPSPELRRALGVALTSRSDAISRVGASIVESRSERSLRKQVLYALEDGPASVQAAAMAALGVVGDQRDLSVVSARLDAKEPEVRAAAAAAMGRLGNLDAVQRLLPLTRGLGQPGRVKEAARAAVVAIQNRFGGGVRGGLSVVGTDDAGRLSPPSDGGQSSLVSETDGDTKRSKKG